MEPILDTALNTFPTIVFCVVVWILVNLQRRILEKWIFPWIKGKTSKDLASTAFYGEVAVPAAPLGTSTLLALLIPQYPLPVVMEGSWGRIIMGLFLGLCAGWVYRVVKKYFQAKLNGSSATVSVPPPSNDIEISTPTPNLEVTDSALNREDVDISEIEDKDKKDQ